MTTHVLQVLDASGSMHGLAADVRGGVDSYIKSLREDGGDYRVTIVTFATAITVLCVDTPVDQVPDITTANYAPAGGTALFDAVEQTVREFVDRVPRLPDGDRALLVVNSDGGDNESYRSTVHSARTLITALEQTGRWQVVMVMTGVDGWSQAADMGIARASTASIPATSGATIRAYNNLSGLTVAYASAGPSATAGADLAAGTAG